MPDVIKLLPDSVANQIAAGEVIQRPASVVKELMENSVDAGGKHISVIIRDAGKTLIQVIDDGCGMSETDARLAFERHATSKISSAQDLFAITTKGFRGEALASIAAVAMLELKTRKEEDETGTLIAISGSRVEVQEPCSCPVGSSFSVKNLFFNIPARRKFLKTDNTENRHIINEFQKVALAHPSIRFTLIHNDNELYDLKPGNLRQRIVGVMGRQINNDLITIDTETSLVTVRGFVGKPENAKRTYGEQFFFINNRFMKHPYFHKAVIEAYQNILPPEAIPSYFIFLEADPASIDINIHPTKTEIKFEDERAIWQILMASVREALGRFNIVPSLDFESEGLIEMPVVGTSDTLPKQPVIDIDRHFNPFEGEEKGYVRRDYIDQFEKENLSNWEKLYPSQESPIGENKKFDQLKENQRRLFQIRNKYLVCPVKSGLMLIDQKRAHERILFERNLMCFSNARTASQADMFPVTIDLNPSDYILLKEIEDDLETMGFKFEHHDKNGITVTGRPSGSESDNIREILEILLEEYKNTQNNPAGGEKARIASAMASASAIPYGKHLTQEEMENLFDTLFACQSPNYSPKGKSIITILTIEEIDRKFN
jgi:DNA mismatch repair protein MutL